MGAMPRKDYNGAKDIPLSNEVFKRVNTQNSPYSIQATGHDLTAARSAKAKMSSENIDALITNNRLLDGNREKFVRTVTKSTVIGSETVTTSVVLTYQDENTGEYVNETYTKDQLLRSSSLFIAKNPA